MLQQCVMNHCCNITLEVRESNIPAQKLYQKYQFQVVAKRYRYYKNEDAILWKGSCSMKSTYILAIESSCDETSVSIIKDGYEEIATVVLTQIDIHKLFGG